MARETLFKNHITAVRTVNVPGTLTEIIRFRVPDRVVYSLLDGTVIKMKLRDTNGIELSEDTELILSGLTPGAILPKSIDKVLYDGWRQLTLAQQADIANQAALRISVPYGGVTFPEQNTLIIAINGNLPIDWDNCSLTFDVQKEPMKYI